MRKAAAMHARAVETARLLRALGNTRRRLILCRLCTRGEASAAQLAEELGLGLSALSQHAPRACSASAGTVASCSSASANSRRGNCRGCSPASAATSRCPPPQQEMTR